MASPRQQLTRLKKLLLARDVDLIVQGVEFVVSMDDPGLWDSLLDGVAYAGDREGGPGLVPNKLFTGTAPAQPYHDLALVLLVAHSPLQALKEQITSLALGAGPRGHRLQRLQLEGLERLPRLEHLSLALPEEGLSLAPLGRCPCLRKLEIQGSAMLEDLQGLGQSPSLQELSIEAPLRSTSGLGGAPVQALRVWSAALQDLSELDQLPLRTAELGRAAQIDPAPLARCRSLEALTLAFREVPAQRLAGCPVRSLTVEGRLTGTLPALPALERLDLHGMDGCAPQPGLRELRARQWAEALSIAEAFPALARLVLQGGAYPKLELLRGLQLDTLVLAGCRLADLSALAAANVRALCLREPDVDHLHPLPRALNVDLEGEPSEILQLKFTTLRSLQGVGQLQGVRLLDVSHCPYLFSLEGLAGTDIRVIDARGCKNLTNLTALEKMPQLRLIALHDTRWNATNLPKGLVRLASFSPTPDLAAALRSDRLPTVPPRR